MPQIRIQVERNVAKEFWSFKKERNLVSFSPKIGNMQPILFLHFCEKICTEKKKKVISIARSTRRREKSKKNNIEFLNLFSFQYVATNIEGWLKNFYFLSVLAAWKIS